MTHHPDCPDCTTAALCKDCDLGNQPAACPVCGPAEVCRKCRKPFPHSAEECDEQNDLVQVHTVEAFGVTIPIRVELREVGRPKIRDLDGPNYWDVHVSVRGAGTTFETTDPGSERAIEETRLQHQAEREHREANRG